jgi:hypothetical protein
MAGTPSFIVNKISTLRFAFFATTNKFIVIIAEVLDICQEFESFPQVEDGIARLILCNAIKIPFLK